MTCEVYVDALLNETAQQAAASLPHSLLSTPSTLARHFGNLATSNSAALSSIS